MALEGLNKIDWQALGSAIGPAVEVPSAIRLLMSDDPERRREGYWKLDNRVVVQSDLYDAAPYVVPFLLEILEDPSRRGNDLVYELLFEIGHGKAPVSARTDFTLPGWREGDRPLESACHDAVKSGIRRFLVDIQGPDPEISIKAGRLVAMLGWRDPEVKERLRRAVEALPDVALRERLRAECEV